MLVHPIKTPIHLKKPFFHMPAEGHAALVNLGELPLDLAELPGQKLDQLLILARTHAAYLPLPPEPFNCIPEETPPSVVNSSLHVPKEGPSKSF